MLINVFTFKNDTFEFFFFFESKYLDCWFPHFADRIPKQHPESSELSRAFSEFAITVCLSSSSPLPSTPVRVVTTNLCTTIHLDHLESIHKWFVLHRAALFTPLASEFYVVPFKMERAFLSSKSTLHTGLPACLPVYLSIYLPFCFST